MTQELPHGRVRRWLGVPVLVCAVVPPFSAPLDQLPETVAVEGFVPDVTEEEWNAALPATTHGLPMPRQVKGPKGYGIPRGLERGQRVFVVVAGVIRADGTQGVYRVIATNHPAFAREVAKVLCKQRFDPPIWKGQAVAIRGDFTHVLELKKRPSFGRP